MKAFLADFVEGSDYKKILMLVLLSVLVKAVIIPHVMVINPDGVRYANSAHHLLQGNFREAFGHEKMLFYSLTLGVFQLVIKDWFWAGKILSSVFLTLTLIPLYYLTRELFGRNAAFWSGLVFILLPSANSIAAEVVKDAPFLFFILTALFLGVKALQNPRPLYFLLTFCSASAATLFRLEGIVFILAYLPAVVVVLAVSDERRKYLRGLAVFLAIPSLAIILSAVLFLTGFFPSEALQIAWKPFARHYFSFDFLNNYHQIYDYLKSVEGRFRGGEWGQDFFEIARRNMAWIYLWGMFLKFFKEIFPIFLIPLALGLACRDRYRGGLIVLLWLSFSYLAMNYYFIISRNFISGRYLMVAVLFLLPVIGFGLERARIWTNNLKYSKIALLTLFFLFVFYPASKSFSDSIENKKEIRECALWLQNNKTLLNKKIITTEERVLFHAGMLREKYHNFTINNKENLEKAAVENQCDFIVLSTSENDILKTGMTNYHLVKEFNGKKISVLVFGKNV